MAWDEFETLGSSVKEKNTQSTPCEVSTRPDVCSPNLSPGALVETVVVRRVIELPIIRARKKKVLTPFLIVLRPLDTTPPLLLFCGYRTSTISTAAAAAAAAAAAGCCRYNDGDAHDDGHGSCCCCCWLLLLLLLLHYYHYIRLRLYYDDDCYCY